MQIISWLQLPIAPKEASCNDLGFAKPTLIAKLHDFDQLFLRP
jgi:hypothetical protein